MEPLQTPSPAMPPDAVVPAPGATGPGSAPITGASSAPAPTRRAAFGRWARREKAAATALGFLVVLGLVMILAPVLAPHDPATQDLSNMLGGISGTHWFGTDDLGRDVFSRMLFGARASVLSAMLAVVVALGLGTPLGILTGYLGGRVDDVFMRIVDTLMSFPAIILAIAVTAALGPGLTNAMIAVGIVLSPIFARLMRGQVMAVKGELYVDASKTFGAPHRYIVGRHVLPNAIQPVIVQCALMLAVALIAEASLSFLGLGVQPPDPSWGAMLGRAYRNMHIAPFQMLVPGSAIVLTVLAFNTLGDALRILLDPMSRHGRK